MCKEDIRIARKATAGVSVADNVYGSNAVIMRANPNRYSLTAVLIVSSPTTDNAMVIVSSLMNGGRFPLIALGSDHIGKTITVMDVGEAILGNIVIEQFGGTTDLSWRVAETAFTESLEDL